MSRPSTFTHTPLEPEDTKKLREMGIEATPQLGLGARVCLTKAGAFWEGFVLSIDRAGQQPTIFVHWTSRPPHANDRDGYGLFNASQLSRKDDGSWEVDPTTVQ